MSKLVVCETARRERKTVSEEVHTYQYPSPIYVFMF